jgi:hypothetical protein
MEKGVDVSANMINHADESGCAPQLIARDSKIPLAKIVVAKVRYNDRFWKKFVRRHVVRQRDRQVNNSSAHFISYSVTYGVRRRSED